MAISISGRMSTLEARARPDVAQAFQSPAQLDVLNGTGCDINGDGPSKYARAAADTSCSGNKQQVDAGLADCVKLAKSGQSAAGQSADGQSAAGQAAAGGGSQLFKQYFKRVDSNARNEVAQVFAGIVEGCSSNGNSAVTVGCTPNEACYFRGREMSAKSDIQSGGPASVRLCRMAFQMNQGGGCGNDLASLGELLVHEMAHATRAKHDLGYGKQNATALSASDSLDNAENYALFARDVSAGCAGQDPGNGNQPPNNDNGGVENPFNNQGGNDIDQGGNDNLPGNNIDQGGNDNLPGNNIDQGGNDNLPGNNIDQGGNNIDQGGNNIDQGGNNNFPGLPGGSDKPPGISGPGMDQGGNDIDQGGNNNLPGLPGGSDKLPGISGPGMDQGGNSNLPGFSGGNDKLPGISGPEMDQGGNNNLSGFLGSGTGPDEELSNGQGPDGFSGLDATSGAEQSSGPSAGGPGGGQFFNGDNSLPEGMDDFSN